MIAADRSNLATTHSSGYLESTAARPSVAAAGGQTGINLAADGPSAPFLARHTRQVAGALQVASLR